MKWYLEALKKYATFSGRAQRSEYWYFVLFNTLIVVGLAMVGGMTGFTILAPIYNLGTLIPSIAVFFRRLHDSNRSGWWWLIGLIPLIGWVVLLVFMVEDSQPGDNRFGPNPKGESAGGQAASGGLPKVALFAIVGVVLLFVVGVLAAVALPAYQDYQKRAAQAEAKMKAPVPQAKAPAAPRPSPAASAPPPTAAPVAAPSPAVASVPAPAIPAPIALEEPVKAKPMAIEEPKVQRPAAAPRVQQVSRPLQAAPLPCVYKPVMTDEDMARCR